MLCREPRKGFGTRHVAATSLTEPLLYDGKSRDTDNSLNCPDLGISTEWIWGFSGISITPLLICLLQYHVGIVSLIEQ